MADRTVLYNFSLKPGHCIEVKAFIPEGCKRCAINLGTDENNFVLHFNPRFDLLDNRKMIILNSMVNNVFGEEQKESFFPLQEGSDTTVCFHFEQDKILIYLPTGNPLSFAIRFPVEKISYLSLVNLQLKFITLK